MPKLNNLSNEQKEMLRSLFNELLDAPDLSYSIDAEIMETEPENGFKRYIPTGVQTLTIRGYKDVK